MSKIYDDTVIVKGNEKLNPFYYLLTFESERFSNSVKPGQFLNLNLNTPDCFLRRPFSVYDIRGKDILILYMVVGRGTEFMAALRPGDVLEALGPLGKGFTIPEGSTSVYLLGGGTGIGSVYLLYSTLMRQKFSNITLAVGFRNSEYFFDDLKASNVVVYTEDGSQGKRGFVTEVLGEVVKNPKGKSVYACGPHGMLAAVDKSLRGQQCFAEISLEETMACGVGACLGCVAETKEGRETVCKDGPIFKLDRFSTLFFS